MEKRPPANVGDLERQGEAQTQVKTGPVQQGDVTGVQRSGGFPGPALVSLMPQSHSRKNFS